MIGPPGSSSLSRRTRPFRICQETSTREQCPAADVHFTRRTERDFTGWADFQVRAQSTLRRASDVIAKPFMFIELTVKALTFALRHRIDTQKQLAAVTGAPARAGQPEDEAALII